MARSGVVSAVVGGLVAAVVVAAASVAGALRAPGLIEDIPVFCRADVPLARAGEPLRVLVWNIQYGASTKHHFFYDGGQAVAVPAVDVAWTLDQIVEMVRALDPDLVLWQEVDRGSARTGGVDQLAILSERLGHGCRASATYHRVPYVPHPSHAHLGRVDMQLAVTGRVRLAEARRHQLALLVEPWWRRVFNLRRAALEVEVPTVGGPTLTLIDTHLSAFSFGDGSLPRQVAQLEALVDAAVARGDAVVLAGDLNSLPPGDDPARLPERDRALYADGASPVAGLYARLTPALGLDAIAADPARTYTYVPFGGAPDRMIDHAFVAGPVRAADFRVIQDRLDVSDHLPLVFAVTVSPDPP
jgi:endonuclease/exonuclease/phosphatase family metal-dependent hydrolase